MLTLHKVIYLFLRDLDQHFGLAFFRPWLFSRTAAEAAERSVSRQGRRLRCVPAARLCLCCRTQLLRSLSPSVSGRDMGAMTVPCVASWITSKVCTEMSGNSAHPVSLKRVSAAHLSLLGWPGAPGCFSLPIYCLLFI